MVEYPTRFAKRLFLLFLVCAGILAVDPVSPFDWALENALTAIALVVLVATARSFPLSRISYALIFVYLILHSVGAHYTYSRVPLPWEEWGFERNHYDRVVHFAFGFLLAYPIREMFLRVADAKGFWGFYLPVDLTLAFSAVYEIIEWLSVVVLPKEAGDDFLGSQGDPFDAIKDMALAGLGAVLAMAVTAALLRRYHRDFAVEMRDSLRVKRREPLGEVRVAELRKRGP